MTSPIPTLAPAPPIPNQAPLSAEPSTPNPALPAHQSISALGKAASLAQSRTSPVLDLVSPTDHLAVSVHSAIPRHSTAALDRLPAIQNQPSTSQPHSAAR
jgi:hypothetical protein